ncbi:MAG: DegT/DnrJ/EryC1/StrS family aminotransferase [Candidatus Omnitrophica bacterium]|nr:DegT/DnrJ/EryC1/StrS family aminotransferase [Candidatus Omnitrophota bacterium]
MKNKDSKETIVMFWPHISPRVIKELSKVLKTRWIGQGPKVEELERKFKNMYKLPYVVTTNNCTAAIHLSLILAGVKDGDEVITTPMTCSATNIPILYCRGKAVFVDIQEDTLNIDPRSIEQKITEKTKAIIAVHWAGYPCDMDEILKIAKRHNLCVIEDAAHALGAYYHGRRIGSIGDYTCFSFQAIKQITSADGGILTVQTEDDYKRAKLLRWYGIDRTFIGDIYWKYQIKEIGYKYHMNDVTATILITQLDELSKVLSRRKKIVQIYRENLNKVAGLELLESKDDRISGNWLFTIKVEDRKGFIEKLHQNQIESHMCHIRCDVYPIFGGERLNLPAMNKVEDKYVSIPLHTKLTDMDVKRVIKVIRSGW